MSNDKLAATGYTGRVSEEAKMERNSLQGVEPVLPNLDYLDDISPRSASEHRAAQFELPSKKVATAYIWLIFLAIVGAHKFYLGRPGMGILYICTGGLLGIGTLVDIFTLESQVVRANSKRFIQGAR